MTGIEPILGLTGKPTLYEILHIDGGSASLRAGQVVLATFDHKKVHVKLQTITNQNRRIAVIDCLFQLKLIKQTTMSASKKFVKTNADLANFLYGLADLEQIEINLAFSKKGESK
jgi:hypothetical protein